MSTLSETTVKAARAEVQNLSAREKTVRADYEDLVKRLMTEKDRIEKERDEARSQQNADERICAQRDEAIVSRNSWRDEANRLEIKLSDVTRRLQRAEEVRRANTRPEPSRLEIAARIMQGWAGNSLPGVMPGPDSALRIADSLIAAAKEVAK